jgi:hypothetical protein
VALELTDDPPFALVLPDNSKPAPNHITCIIGGNDAIELLLCILFAIKLLCINDTLIGRLSGLKSLTFMTPSEYKTDVSG